MQMTEVDQGRRIGRSLSSEIEPAERREHSDVVDRVFADFVA